MKRLFRSKAFYLGFITTLLLLLCLNLFLYLMSGRCHHCYSSAGFPFVFWVNQIDFALGFSADGRLLPSGDTRHFSFAHLAADILLTVFFSSAVGFIAKWVSLNFASRRLK